MVIVCKEYLNLPGMYEAITEHFGENGIRVICRKEYSEWEINSSVKFNIIETNSLIHVILNGPQEETAEVIADLDGVIKQFNLAKTA